MIGSLSTLVNVLVIAKSVVRMSKTGRNSVVFRDILLITFIAAGDLLVGVYLLLIAIIDDHKGASYCTEQFQWKGSSQCLVLGSLSSIGSQMSLFTMTILSVYRLHRIRNIFQRPYISTKWWGVTLTLCFLIIASSVIISIVPTMTIFEDFFINGLSYNNITLFVGLVNKQVHTSVIKKYYISNFRAELSWAGVRDLVAGMFSDDHAKVNGTGVGFYGNAGVCLFKYFVTPDDPQQRFSLVVLLINFICFGIITGCYMGVWVFYRGNTVYDQHINTALQRKISLIIISDACCWIPFNTIGLLHYFRVMDASQLYEFCSIIALPINSLVNAGDRVIEKVISRISSGSRATQEQTQDRRDEQGAGIEGIQLQIIGQSGHKING